MRSGFLLVSATCVLGSAPTRADEFKNPPVIKVRSPGGDLTIRARQGTASVPGLGDVERVYGYEVRRGTAFPRERSGPPTSIGLMPPVISRDHASGMYWFHPHPHGLSEGQVSNGLSGLMFIGNLWDTSYVKCRITASPDVAGLGACADQEAQREELQAERRAGAAATRL